jgi:hypothetical protein
MKKYTFKENLRNFYRYGYIDWIRAAFFIFLIWLVYYCWHEWKYVIQPERELQAKRGCFYPRGASTQIINGNSHFYLIDKDGITREVSFSLYTNYTTYGGIVCPN